MLFVVTWYWPKIEGHLPNPATISLIPLKTAKNNALSLRLHGLDSGTTLVEGYKNGDENVQLGSLKSWPSSGVNCRPPLTSCCSGDLIRGDISRKKLARRRHDRRYPTIIKIPAGADTTTMPSDTSKRLPTVD